MAIEITDSGPWSYVATAGATTFQYKNIVWASSDLAVYVNDVLISPTEYTVTNIGVKTGGNVVFNTGLTGGETVKIVSNIPETQELIYKDGSPSKAQAKETALDRLMRTVQQVRASLAAGTGETNTAQNLGAGEGQTFAQKVMEVLQFRSLKAGANITITQTADEITITGAAAGGGAVDSVFGRTGAVVAVSGDYNADQTTETAGRIWFTPAALAHLSGIEAGAQVNAVTSVHGRTGAVVAASGDYTADQITETASLIFFTPTEKTKLAGIATGAQVNYPGKRSIEVDADAYQLVGDEDMPTDGWFYGMAAGARAWMPLPKGGSAIWVFDIPTAAAFPGQGVFRLNTGAWDTATELYIAGETAGAVNVDFFIEELRAGQLFDIEQIGSAERGAYYRMTGPAVKTGTAPNHWYTLPVTLEDEGAAFLQDNRECRLTYFGIGGSAAESQRGEVTDIITVSGTTHTLSDAGKGAQHELTNAAGCAVTVPPDSTVIPIKAAFYFAAAAAGAVTFLEGSGVTINLPTGKQAALRAQGSGGNLMKIGINAWRLQGDLLDT